MARAPNVQLRMKIQELLKEHKPSEVAEILNVSRSLVTYYKKKPDLKDALWINYN